MLYLFFTSSYLYDSFFILYKTYFHLFTTPAVNFLRFQLNIREKHMYVQHYGPLYNDYWTETDCLTVCLVAAWLTTCPIRSATQQTQSALWTFQWNWEIFLHKLHAISLLFYNLLLLLQLSFQFFSFTFFFFVTILLLQSSFAHSFIHSFIHLQHQKIAWKNLYRFYLSMWLR